MSIVEGFKSIVIKLLLSPDWPKVPARELRKNLLLEGRKSPFAPPDTHPLFSHLFPALGPDEEVKKYSSAEGKPVDIVSKTFASLSFQ